MISSMEKKKNGENTRDKRARANKNKGQELGYSLEKGAPALHELGRQDVVLGSDMSTIIQITGDDFVRGHGKEVRSLASEVQVSHQLLLLLPSFQ